MKPAALDADDLFHALAAVGRREASTVPRKPSASFSSVVMS